MFTEALDVELILTIKDKKIKIPGGNVRRIKGELYLFGFECEVSFYIYSEEKKDSLYPMFLNDDIIEASILLSPHFKEKSKDFFNIKLEGIVKEKQILSEDIIENIHLKQNPVLCREYFIRFVDKAKFLWTNYFPCDLKVNKKVIDLFKFHELGVKVRYDIDELNENKSINTLPLGVEDNKASYYDFLIWYISKFYGGLFYDYENNSYIISKKIPKKNKNFLINKTEVEWYHVTFPVHLNYDLELLNGCAKVKERKVLSSSKKIHEDLKHSKVFLCPIVSDFEKRVSIEREHYKKKKYPKIELRFKKLPQSGHIFPGKLLKFKGELWSKDQFVKDKEFYINTLSFELVSIEKETESYKDLEYNKFTTNMKLIADSKENECIELPEYRDPRFPMLVEGYVVSEFGDEKDETYQVYKDDRGIEFYKVSIPIFDDAQIIVQYNPIFLPGHFYFPLYKGTKVLVSLYMHEAFIERILEWREGARLPLDAQNNSIIMGKTKTSQISLISFYDKNKPKLEIKRTSQKDTQIVEMGEGVIIFETKEEKD